MTNVEGCPHKREEEAAAGPQASPTGNSPAHNTVTVTPSSFKSE